MSNNANSLNEKLNDLRSSITYIVEDAKIVKKNEEIKIKSEILPKLVALVFCMWTLSNAESYYDAKGVEDQKDYLRVPHPAQVISLFRLLGIGDSTEKIVNNLVQVKTGEGKSIILAIASCILALLGTTYSAFATANI